jgi:hypothetical protein
VGITIVPQTALRWGEDVDRNGDDNATNRNLLDVDRHYSGVAGCGGF